MPPEFALTEEAIDADRHVVAVRGEIEVELPLARAG